MSNAIFNLDATIRTDLGKGASRRLRHQDKVPAIIYGGEEAPMSITLEQNKVNQAQDFEAFYSHVLTINVEGKKVEALVKDMQRHPYKPKVMHIDFQRVIAGQLITTSVPIHFINEDNAGSIKTDGGHPEHHMNEVEVSCMPKDLPEFIEVDIIDLPLGETIHLSDLTFPKGVESVELGKGADHDLAVVTVKLARGPSAAAADEDEEDSTEA